MPMLFLDSMRKKVANVIMFSPPNCARNIIMICPLRVKYMAMSTVERPVTQLADVAVKSASTKCRFTPSTVIFGSIRSPVPESMSTTNDSTNSFCADICMEGRKDDARPISIISNMTNETCSTTTENILGLSTSSTVLSKSFTNTGDVASYISTHSIIPNRIPLTRYSLKYFFGLNEYR